MTMPSIKIAIAGIGNCASSLLQGFAWYSSRNQTTGLAHPILGGYSIADIHVVAAFDIDTRKVGRPLEEAIFALPNNTKRFCTEIPATGRINGTPASSRANVPPQTVAIDELPLDSMMSETTRTTYGKISGVGNTGSSDRSANAPCPISRRPGPMIRLTSPVENGGKL